MRAAVAAVALLPLAACGSTGGASPAASTAPQVTGTFKAAGASSQQKAMGAWIEGFTAANPGVSVTYDPAGSGKGREEFLAGTTAYGASDVPLTDDEMKASGQACDGGNAIDLPVYISPIVVVFDVPGVAALNLSSATIARLFTGKIHTWDDAEVAADNPGVQLPDLPVTPVHRSDSSGTTDNFTDWLHATAPDAWEFDASSDWPLADGLSGEGTGGVVDVVKATAGAVAYVDASQAGGMGTAAINVGGTWVKSSAAGAAGAAGLSPRDESRYQDDMSYRLDRTTTNTNAYPLVLVSYLLVCSRYTDHEQGQFVKAFVDYIASDAGQAAGTKAAGSAALTPAQQDWLRSAANDIFLVPEAKAKS
ncbi:MAG: phosphate ABC transporter substrate-binding protein PstS [Promicromonosporaceae bacterium]|nr:phosphate ABC transporter substrate-binding protein PstS [Promicromonosporaceae bacterium]